MITIIEMNRTIWYGKMIVAAFTLFIIPAVLFFVDWHTQIQGSANNIRFLPTFFLILMFSSNALEFYFIPMGAILDTDAKQIEVKYFFRANRMIYLDEIDSLYSNSITTRYKTTGTDYDGIIIYLKTGEKVLFSDMYLADQSDISIFLKNAGVADNGVQDFNKFTYCWDSYKASKKAI